MCRPPFADPNLTPRGPRPVNRARQLKMTETMSEPALARWLALSETEHRMMVQVGLKGWMDGVQLGAATTISCLP